ncbi:hypothetical protein [uncultured Phenylobacterium sp.]|uniref:hypothetical protein n=1 Tax=uncultured Phenylobacterium sp. TaxID=349273 RepID=UPI0025EE6446|nr:hypothetical protein [uncultured Phenylobacterium sp.]
MTRTMLGAITFRALGISARRILDALLYEHMSNGGAENGNLGGTYEQLELWGVTAADVRKGYAELYATGFVRQTVQGYFAIGGQVQSRYALTWLPTGFGRAAIPPKHEWLDVIGRLQKQGVGNVRAAKQWLRAEVADHGRGKRKVAAQVQVLRPLKREAGGR